MYYNSRWYGETEGAFNCFQSFELKNPLRHFVLKYRSLSCRRLKYGKSKRKHRFFDTFGLFVGIYCGSWPSFVRRMWLTPFFFYDFLLDGWTTTSWRNHYQTFLAKASCCGACKFISCFIYAKETLNPNLPNREVMFYFLMTEMSSILQLWCYFLCWCAVSLHPHLPCFDLCWTLCATLVSLNINISPWNDHP